MLQRLILRNFQQHETLEVPLSPTLTVLVGDSRSGKSTALRALRWVCQGGPSVGFLRHGADSAEATLHFDSHTLTRAKGKGRNSYSLDDKVFAAVGTGVPEEVLTLLRLSDVNFQSQLDPPFWLSLSPPEAARELNKVVSLDLIDSSLASLANSLRKAVAQEELCKSRLERSEQRLKELSWVPSAQQDLEALEALESDIASRRTRIARVALLLEEAGQVAQDTLGVSEIATEALLLEQCLERVATLGGRVSRLESLVNQYKTSEGERHRSTEELTQVDAELREATAGMCPLCGRGG